MKGPKTHKERGAATHKDRRKPSPPQSPRNAAPAPAEEPAAVAASSELLPSGFTLDSISLFPDPRAAVERILVSLDADGDGMVIAPLDDIRQAVRVFTAALGNAIRDGHGSPDTWRRWQTAVGKLSLATRGLDGDALLPEPDLLTRALDDAATDLVRYARTEAGPRNAWAGDPVIHFKGARHSHAARYSDATLRPDPERAMATLRAERDVTDPDRPWGSGDVIAVLNYVTSALRNDLPTPDRRDTAAIWDSWRRTILDVAPDLRRALPHTPFRDTHRIDAVLDELPRKLVEAHAHPGQIGARYCPWAADFFTMERLYPEAS